MYVEITPEGILSQFAGYMELEEIDLDAYRKKYGDIHRMDRILKSENDSPDKYKVAKQADTLMAFYLLPVEDIQEILKRLGYPIRDYRSFLKNNFDYYLKRTSHGSTLSKVVHAVVAKVMGDASQSWDLFMDALKSDIYDTQGGTTVEGIHCGVMAGTIGIIIRIFAGVKFSHGNIAITPSLPDHWNALSFKLMFNGKWHLFEITREEVKVHIEEEDRPFIISVSNSK
jgi:trehalose/maltose hydrolase-like predicted phosphorylase